MSSSFCSFRKKTALVLKCSCICCICFVLCVCICGCLQDFLLIFGFHHYEYDNSRCIMCEHISSFLLGTYLEPELLNHMVTMSSILKKCQAFFQVADPFYNPVSNVWAFQFFYILASICYCSPFLF